MRLYVTEFPRCTDGAVDAATMHVPAETLRARRMSLEG
jgi:hypothetical protein